MADPLADHRSQLVRLFLQSANPRRLDGQIATQFCDLALDRERQCDGRLGTSSPHAAYDYTLNIASGSYPDRPGWRLYVLFGTEGRPLASRLALRDHS